MKHVTDLLPMGGGLAYDIAHKYAVFKPIQEIEDEADQKNRQAAAGRFRLAQALGPQTKAERQNEDYQDWGKLCGSGNDIMAFASDVTGDLSLFAETVSAGALALAPFTAGGSVPIAVTATSWGEGLGSLSGVLSNIGIETQALYLDYEAVMSQDGAFARSTVLDTYADNNLDVANQIIALIPFSKTCEAAKNLLTNPDKAMTTMKKVGPMMAKVESWIALGKKVNKRAHKWLHQNQNMVRWITFAQKLPATYDALVNLMNRVHQLKAAVGDVVSGGVHGVEGAAKGATDVLVKGGRAGIGLLDNLVSTAGGLVSKGAQSVLKGSEKALSFSGSMLHQILPGPLPRDGEYTGPYYGEVGVRFSMEPEQAIAQGATLYINGIDTSYAEHCSTAVRLAQSLGKQGAVVGIYSATGGMLKDLAGALWDKATLAQADPVTQKLVQLIDKYGSAHKSDGGLRIVAHSRGSILVSDALWLARRKGDDLHNLDVTTYGDAAFINPQGPTYHHREFENDPIPAFFGNSSLLAYGLHAGLSLPIVGETLKRQGIADPLATTRILPHGGVGFEAHSISTGGKDDYLGRSKDFDTTPQASQWFGLRPTLTAGYAVRMGIDEWIGDKALGTGEFIGEQVYSGLQGLGSTLMGAEALLTDFFSHKHDEKRQEHKHHKLPKHHRHVEDAPASLLMHHVDMPTVLQGKNGVNNADAREGSNAVSISPAASKSKPGQVQRSGSGDAPDVDAHTLRQDLLRSGGSGFAPDTRLRQQLADPLGFDPAGARLHRNPAAAAAARSLNAQAFTIGRDVFFGEGKFDAASREGLGLIAHELTHVGQQTGTIGAQTRFFSRRGGDEMEQEAQHVAERVLANVGKREGLFIEDYLRSYQSEEEQGLTHADQQRLDHISLMALQQAEGTLRQLGMNSLTLETLTVDISLNLSELDDAEAAGVWASALIDAVSNLASLTAERDMVRSVQRVPAKPTEEQPSTSTPSTLPSVPPIAQGPAASTVDWDWIGVNEGKGVDVGYVPNRAVYKVTETVDVHGKKQKTKELQGYQVIGKSGLTIGTGVDLGQKNIDKLAVSPDLKTKLKTGKAGVTIPKGLMTAAERKKLKAEAAQLQLTKDEVVELDAVIHHESETDAARAFNKGNKDTKFDQLPPEVQTVVVDLTHQYGGGGVRKLQSFKNLQQGNWAEAVKAESSRKDYAVRNKRRAALLQIGLEQAGLIPPKAEPVKVQKSPADGTGPNTPDEADARAMEQQVKGGQSGSAMDSLQIADASKGEPLTAKDIVQYEKLKAELARQEIKGAEATGSALKSDPVHRSASFVVDDAAKGRHFTIRGGDGMQRNLTQVEGNMNGEEGIFEWIVDEKGDLTHQRFIPKGRITGEPNQKPGRPIRKTLPEDAAESLSKPSGTRSEGDAAEVLEALKKEGTQAEPAVVEAAQKLAAEMSWAGTVQGVLRVGGRIVIVVAIASDVYTIYKAKDHVKATVTAAGGWAGAGAGAATFTAYWAAADVAGPMAWAVHGAGMLVAGGVGYWVGSNTTRTIYELVLE